MTIIEQLTQLTTAIAAVATAVGIIAHALRQAGVAKEAKFWRTLDEAVGFAEALRKAFTKEKGYAPPPEDSHRAVMTYFRDHAPEILPPTLQQIKAAAGKLPKTIAGPMRGAGGRFASNK